MKKIFKELIIKFLLLFIFITPIIVYGIKDLEEYQLGYFTLKNYIKYPSTFFNGYIDFYGAGSSLHIGHFPFLHPANILFHNTQTHYFFYLFINLGTLIAQYIFLLVFFFSNKNSINLFSNKYFFSGCTFVILISINKLIFLYSSLESFTDNISKVLQKRYVFKDFYTSLIYPLNDLIKANRSPYFNIIFK